VEFDGRRVVISFHRSTPVSPDRIIELIRLEPKKYQFSPDYRFILELNDTSFDGILTEVINLLKRMG
jgi:transcription-repair coupling factor (superfamily II helicase)